jgi:hypothetical protein
MEYDEHEIMIHLMSDEMFAADIATYLFELHKRIEEIENRTTVQDQDACYSSIVF